MFGRFSICLVFNEDIRVEDELELKSLSSTINPVINRLALHNISSLVSFRLL